MTANRTVVDAELGSSSKPVEQALVPLKDDPPRVLPTIVLDDIVPFPGPVVPILLDTQSRRDALLHAKSNNGYFMLVNRLPAKTEHPIELEQRSLDSLHEALTNNGATLSEDTVIDSGDLNKTKT
ncbi:MAG: hypothetical protein R3C68_07685 [Myxococcota bacterium]